MSPRSLLCCSEYSPSDFKRSSYDFHFNPLTSFVAIRYQPSFQTFNVFFELWRPYLHAVGLFKMWSYIRFMQHVEVFFINNFKVTFHHSENWLRFLGWLHTLFLGLQISCNINSKILLFFSGLKFYYIAAVFHRSSIDTVGWVFWPVKTVSHITYTVLAGT